MSKKYFVKMTQHYFNSEKTAYFGPYETKAQALEDIQDEDQKTYELAHSEASRPSYSVVRLNTHTAQGKRYVVATRLNSTICLASFFGGAQHAPFPIKKKIKNEIALDT